MDGLPGNAWQQTHQVITRHLPPTPEVAVCASGVFVEILTNSPRVSTPEHLKR
jgi:hypothetical protein